MYRNQFIPNSYNDARFGGFFIPFLAGGLAGSAIVGLSRPRPVYVQPGPMPGPYPYYYPY